MSVQYKQRFPPSVSGWIRDNENKYKNLFRQGIDVLSYRCPYCGNMERNAPKYCPECGKKVEERDYETGNIS